MQALLQSGRLHLPRTAEAQALADELLNYEIKVSEDANDRYGAFRVGKHDDLVTALGLAVFDEPAGVGTPVSGGAPRMFRADSRELGVPWYGPGLSGAPTRAGGW